MHCRYKADTLFKGPREIGGVENYFPFLKKHEKERKQRTKRKSSAFLIQASLGA